MKLRKAGSEQKKTAVPGQSPPCGGPPEDGCMRLFYTGSVTVKTIRCCP